MLRDVVWMGDSKKKLQEFPKDAQRSIGSALMLAQFGGTAEHVKLFKGVGSGVFEIVESHYKNAYRMVYAVQLGARIYVLHALKKVENRDKNTETRGRPSEAAVQRSTGASEK